MSFDFQRRVVHTEFRAAPDGAEGRITAKVLAYNVVDDYGTTFAPGVFRDSMDQRMPRIVWSHDWAEPLGRWTRYLDDDEGLTLVGELDDFDAVPRARQAWAQLRSGTIDQFSVGFMPEDAMPAVVDGRDVLTFTRGRLDEASLVLVGAVPGTELLALRAPRQHKRDVIVVRTQLDKVEVDPESLAQLFAEVETGDTTAPAALAMLLEGQGVVSDITLDDDEDTTQDAQDAQDEPPAPDAQDDAQDAQDDDVAAQDDHVDEDAQDEPDKVWKPGGGTYVDATDDAPAEPEVDDLDDLVAAAGDVLEKL